MPYREFLVSDKTGVLLTGEVYEIVRDQRDGTRVAVSVMMDDCATRPAISMTLEEAGRFRVAQRVRLVLVGEVEVG